CQTLCAGLAPGTGGGEPCGGYLAQPAVCSRRGQGGALPGPGADAGAKHALNGASASLPQKARREAPSASSFHRKFARTLLQYLDTRVDRPVCNTLTFYAVPHCVYYGLQTRASGCPPPAGRGRARASCMRASIIA